MEGHSLVSPDVLARYAGDAASEVAGVAAVVKARGVEITESDGDVQVTVRVELSWGRSAGTVGRDVQRRVREYLERMADVNMGSVDVVIDRVAAPPAKR